MTCFWDGIIASLTTADFQKIGFENRPKPKEFVKALQTNAIQTTHIHWNGVPLREQELKENLEAISTLNVNSISNGYFCSTSDPFLFLVAELFQVNIIHFYRNVTINYTFIETGESTTIVSRTLKFGSNKSHFYKK